VSVDVHVLSASISNGNLIVPDRCGEGRDEGGAGAGGLGREERGDSLPAYLTSAGSMARSGDGRLG